MGDVIRLNKKEKELIDYVRSYYYENDSKFLEIYGSSDRDMVTLSISLAVSYLRSCTSDTFSKNP